MRTLSIAAVLTLSTMVALVQAQSRSMQLSPDQLREFYRQRMQLQHEEMEREREEAKKSCALPDGSAQPLNHVLSHEGETYRCLEVFLPTLPRDIPPGGGQTLSVRVAGWVKVP
jgi:hypothetical protein